VKCGTTLKAICPALGVPAFNQPSSPTTTVAPTARVGKLIT